MPIDRPVLLLGSTRSGKSMVAGRLAELPEFALAFEPLTTWNIGLTRRPDDRRGARDATPEVSSMIRHEIERYMERSAATRYIDDLPHHALRIAFCAAVLPEARFITVYRDGRDSIRDMLCGWRYRDSLGKVWKRRMGGSSRKALRLTRLPRHGLNWLHNYVRQRSVGRRQTWGPTVPGQHAFSKEHTLVATVAYQWVTLVEHIRQGIAALPPERVLEVHFERLREDPATEFERVADFCDVSDRDRLIALASEAIDPTRPHYSPALTAAEEAEIAPIIGPVQEILGYRPRE